MIVKGRVVQPIVQARSDGHRIYIRIDDQRLLDFWLELEISHSELGLLIVNQSMRGEAELGSSNVVLNAEMAGIPVDGAGKNEPAVPGRADILEQWFDGGTSSCESTG